VFFVPFVVFLIMAQRRNKSVHHDTPPGAQVAAWQWWAIGGVVGYLVLFFNWPLADLPHGADQPPLTRWQLTVEALVADVVLFDWLGQASWIGIGQRLLLVLYVAAYWLIAGCIGMMVVAACDRRRRCTPAERLIFAVGAGMAAVSVYTLLMGMTGWLTQYSFVSKLVIIALFGLKEFLAEMRLGWRQFKDRQRSNHRWETGLLPTLSLLALLAGTMPPLDFDVREYHLQAPKEFYLAGQISFLPHNVYANMPLGAEMHALASMAMLGDWWWGALAGKTVMASFLPLTALALAVAGRRFFSESAGWYAALIYLATPWTTIVGASGLNEGVLGCYTLLALLALAHFWRVNYEVHSRGMVVLAGWFVGAAVACKYTAVVFVAIPLGLALIFAHCVWLQRDWRQTIATATAFTLAALATGGWWFAKNAAQTGNPTYPLLASVFEGESLAPERRAQWRAAHSVPNYAPRDFVERGKRTAISSEWISPVVAPLIVVFLFRHLRQRASHLELLLIAMLAFVWIAWWLFTHRLDRFLTPLLPLAALLAGVGATLLPPLVARGVVLLAVVYGALLVPAGLIGDNRLLADLRQLADDPLSVSSPHQYLNKNADEVTGVLLVGDAQPFMLRPPVRYNTCFDENLLEAICRGRTPVEIAAELHHQKISHILVDWSEIDRYRSPGNYGFTEFIQPEMFNKLQSAGVITPIEPASDERRKLYRLVATGH
jgi:hypothetical protein